MIFKIMIGVNVFIMSIINCYVNWTPINNVVLIEAIIIICNLFGDNLWYKKESICL